MHIKFGLQIIAHNVNISNVHQMHIQFAQTHPFEQPFQQVVIKDSVLLLFDILVFIYLLYHAVVLYSNTTTTNSVFCPLASSSLSHFSSKADFSSCNALSSVSFSLVL